MYDHRLGGTKCQSKDGSSEVPGRRTEDESMEHD